MHHFTPQVLVLSGACYHDCKGKSGSYVPYGTNMGGQTISYKSQVTVYFHVDRNCFFHFTIFLLYEKSISTWIIRPFDGPIKITVKVPDLEH